MRLGGALIAMVLAGCVGPIIPAAAPPQTAQSEMEAPRVEADPEVFTTDKPAWEAQPVSANARSVTEGRYIVQPGDTLRAIGIKTGAGSENLARVNGLTPPYILKPGQILGVPGGRYHTVDTGETGIAIARAYGVPWRQIVAANQLAEPFTLRIGQRLVIPGEAASSTPPTMEERAAAFRLDIEDIISGGEPATRTATQTPIPAPTGSFKGFVWPAYGRIASTFGPKGEGQVNQGVEIAVAPATPIKAAASGTVAFVGQNVAPVGGLILIKHSDGWITAYGHAASASVTRGQKVAQGAEIGRAGSGASPLLFFQTRKNGTPVDPLKQLPAQP